MSKVSRIVLATDLTARSTDAWGRAASLARETGARLTVLHVIDPRQPERVARMQSNRSYAQLLSQAERVFGSGAGFVDIVVRIGNTLETIARTASEWDAELIVVAAPRPRRIDSIVGTTAERLVRTSKRAVLVVHREMQGPYRSAAIAADLSGASTAMVRTAVRLGALDQTNALVVHAIQPSYDGMLRSAGLDESTIGCYQGALQEEARQRLQALIAETGLAPEVTRVVVRSDSPATAIRAVIEEERPELLAIGASRWILLKRLLIGSVADRVLREASCDVLVIPLSVLPVRHEVTGLPGFVPIQRRLEEHHRGDRCARSHE